MRRGRAGGGAALVLALVLGLALACGGSRPQEEWPDVRPQVPSPAARSERPSEAPPAPGPDRAAAPLDLAGVWVGPPCGRRNYERILELRDDGRVRLEERISPCPPGAVCVWSGVEVIDGRWRRQDATLILTLDGSKRPMATEPPERLVVTSEEGRVRLTAPDGCGYTKRPPASDGSSPADASSAEGPSAETPGAETPATDAEPAPAR